MMELAEIAPQGVREQCGCVAQYVRARTVPETNAPESRRVKCWRVGVQDVRCTVCGLRDARRSELAHESIAELGIEPCVPDRFYRAGARRARCASAGQHRAQVRFDQLGALETEILTESLQQDAELCCEKAPLQTRGAAQRGKQSIEDLACTDGDGVESVGAAVLRGSQQRARVPE